MCAPRPNGRRPSGQPSLPRLGRRVARAAADAAVVVATADGPARLTADAPARLGDAQPDWLVLAAALKVASLAGYVAVMGLAVDVHRRTACRVTLAVVPLGGYPEPAVRRSPGARRDRALANDGLMGERWTSNQRRARVKAESLR